MALQAHLATDKQTSRGLKAAETVHLSPEIEALGSPKGDQQHIYVIRPYSIRLAARSRLAAVSVTSRAVTCGSEAEDLKLGRLTSHKDLCSVRAEDLSTSLTHFLKPAH
eukprot:s531_g21.t1